MKCKFQKVRLTADGRECGAPVCACTGVECQCLESECPIAASLGDDNA